MASRWFSVGLPRERLQQDAVRVENGLFLHVWPAGCYGNWWGEVRDNSTGALLWNMAEKDIGPLLESQAKRRLVAEAKRIAKERQ